VGRGLHGVAELDEGPLGAGDGATDQDQAPLHVHPPDGEVQRGDGLDPEVAGHLLALEGLARVLALAGGAVGPVGDADPVGGPHAAEVPALHGALETLADRDPGDIDLLAGDEVVGGDLGAHVDEHVFRDPEFGQGPFGLDLSLGEVAAHGLGGVLGLLEARAELEGHVAVLLLGALGYDLTAFEAEHGHWNVASRFIEEAGHAQLFGDYAGSHRINPLRA
jgi:hypothetical protein